MDLSKENPITKKIPTISVLAIAVLAGLIAINIYSARSPGTVKADSFILTDTDPEWTDLHVVYLIGPDEQVSSDVFAPDVFVTKFNAQVVTSFDALVETGQQQRIDIVVIDKPMLQSVDRDWAIDQYQHGTAFVGLNLTPQVLGDVLNDPDFAHGEGWDDVTYPEPFLSQTMWRASGDPEEIQKLINANALYPLNDWNTETWTRLNIKTVSTIATKGYSDITPEQLVRQLENIRINFSNEFQCTTCEP